MLRQEDAEFEASLGYIVSPGPFQRRKQNQQQSLFFVLSLSLFKRNSDGI